MSKCGAIYHIDFNPPKKDLFCDVDGETLFTRPDDKEEAIANRLNVYHSQTEPLLDYYTKLRKVITINAKVSPDEVYTQIKEKIKL